MNRYQEIVAARQLLELPEAATMESIKSAYRTMLAKSHPDKCSEDQELCEEMTRKIISAYQMIIDYCWQYQYSFSEETVKRHLSHEQWWRERFGNNPLW